MTHLMPLSLYHRSMDGKTVENRSVFMKILESIFGCKIWQVGDCALRWKWVTSCIAGCE
jgi:hypothetical protein